MVIIGKYIQQKGDYKAFIPDKFPPGEMLLNEPKIVKLLANANLQLGKLDGLTKLLPDINFFIFMYINKEAAYSSQVEGTRAKLTDALQAEVERTPDLPKDVDDILHYIKAMNEGLKRLDKLPLSLRLIKEVHATLLTKARSSTNPYPGEFRKSQNWIMGTNPADARFVPPPPEYVMEAMSDLEKFFYSHEDLPILIKAGLIHSQFETIHPFLDGNGRTGRLLITFYLCQQKILERPVLYLSEHFKKHRDLYFSMLDEYRKGNIVSWLDFFLKGIVRVAGEAIETSNKVIELREKDLNKVSELGRASKNAIVLLKNLYRIPIINVRKIEEVADLSREAANQLVDRFVKLGILVPKDKGKKYGRLFVYKEYLNLFEGKED
ncbi:MAG: cell filamentation protein Fic [Candidatus Omnitrophica bacterium CG12_big_fil_rev_8_21_14_0_65_43_15]|uniref:Cell filamentation protein Fic n=1 Tax=Candidatus Taenaricola geysiri TaxID=1974752 RepID=A0A2J0LKS2_9BACT|nr:MAG: cell filamentation protein Fic [Candidatus Omnitrophica bacterium CG10_big_fil_rev_8_21_14_0_10_43_8]PIW66640.1 MAG: cell filamentation protein Fic [Candidatus Omnitrophica bacterium CG12_big_fil_rev_8_21_14_0_65_43_15]PJC46142.1 MAG: cell filamentation protein Fic [Candidatus Omnitrophica bacterium CG_4_9_14_0_2_um_filter_43_12]